MGKGIKRPAKPLKDFSKKKFKVGKRLKKADNETKVDVRVRKLNLPGQTALENKDEFATNDKHLTLKELLAQCGHYSDKVRKRGVTGLADLIQSHPTELELHTGRVVATIAQLLADADKQVRGALHELCAHVVLPRLSSDALAPFLPLLMAHVSGALTHILLDVRTDALQFMDLLLSHSPALLVAGHSSSVLHHFCDALSQSQRSRTMKARSLDNLVNTLRKLSSFLHAATPDAATSADAPSAPSVAHHSERAQCVHDRIAVQRLCASVPAVPLLPGILSFVALAHTNLQIPGLGARSAGAWGPGEGGAAPGGGGGGQSVDGSAAQLVGHLMACWEECSPAELAVAPEETALECLVLILDSLVCVASLLGANRAHHSDASEAQVAVREQFRAFLHKRVVPCFPVSVPGRQPSAALAHNLVRFNTTSARLLSAFLPLLMSPLPSALCSKAAASGSARPEQSKPKNKSRRQGSQPSRALGRAVSREQADAAPCDKSESALTRLTASALHANGEAGLVEFVRGAAQGSEAPSGAGTAPLPPPPGAHLCLERLLDHYLAVAVHGVAVPARAGLGSSGEGLPAPTTSFAAALHGLELALEHVDADARARLLQDLTQLAARKLPVVKRVEVVLFQHRVVCGGGAAGAHAGAIPGLPQETLVQWLAGLPQAAWELGWKRPDAARRVWEVLHAAARVTQHDSAVAAALLKVQPALLSNFLVPGKADTTSKAEPVMLQSGPLAACDASVQTLALDVLYFMPTLLKSTLAALQSVALSNLYPAAVAVRIAALASTRFGACEPLPTLRMLTALLTCADSSLADAQRCSKSISLPEPTVTQPGAGDTQPWARHTALADAVAHGLCRMEQVAPGLLEAIHPAVQPEKAPSSPGALATAGGAVAADIALHRLRWHYGGLLLCQRALEYGVAPPCWRESASGRVAEYVLAWVAACNAAAPPHAAHAADADAQWPMLPRTCSSAPGLLPALAVLELAPDAAAPAIAALGVAVEQAALGASAAEQQARKDAEPATLSRSCGAKIAECSQAVLVMMWSLLRGDGLGAMPTTARDGAITAFVSACERVSAAAPALAGDPRQDIALQECNRLLARLQHLFPEQMKRS